MPKNIYRNKAGEILPGCTTICGQLDKPQLIDWAWRLGKEGKDWKEQRDSAGDIGTEIHAIIMDFLSGRQFPDDMPPLIDKCITKFEDWYVANFGICEPKILIEQPLVSEKYGFGGQPDIYLLGQRRLIDIKTSNGIYESYWYQLAGYDILLRENGYKVDEYQILWLPKDNRFDCPIRTDLRKEKRIFKHLLGIYYDRRE